MGSDADSHAGDPHAGVGHDSHTVRVPNPEWDPQVALQSLVLESHFDDGDQVQATARLLREHALMAAQSVAQLSCYAESERVRMQASTYIIDKVMAAELNHDLNLKRDQVQVVGQALYAAVRALGLRHGFRHDDAATRSIVQDALLTLAAPQSPRDQPIDASLIPDASSSSSSTSDSSGSDASSSSYDDVSSSARSGPS